MSIRYNAFISYCHGDPDSAVAKDVQRQLEHFHIPRAIRKLTGRKKIERIFRDKDELPISSDLGRDITEALENSEFLIVICSERTSASHWVMREIETFLQTHDINHVLTVTAHGEPSAVVPGILTSRTVTETAPDGTTFTRTELLEPLSCDYRIGFRKARKEELPRLAAAMLGCTYDQLIQRSRQYRHRVTALALSGVSLASVAFGVYSFRTGMEIQRNYNQALLSQSQFFASESDELLEEGDRMAAVSLALEALPREGENRPYLASAEQALSSALGIYSSAQVNAVNIRPASSFQFENSLSSFLVSTTEKYLICKDTSGCIYVHDISDNALLGIIPGWKAEDAGLAAQSAASAVNPDEPGTEGCSESADDEAPDSAGITRDDYSLSAPDLLGTVGDDAVVLYNNHTLWCYSLPECEVIWRQDLVAGDEFTRIQYAALNPSGSRIAAMAKENIYLLDALSGTIMKKEAFPAFEQDYGFLADTVPYGIFSGYMTFSDDEQSAIFSIFAYTTDDYGASYNRACLPALLNMETGEVAYYPQKGYDTYRAGINHAGNLLLISMEAGSEESHYAFGGYMMCETRMHIHCVNPETSEIVWHTEFPSTQLSPHTEYFSIIFTDDNGRDHNATALITSNRILILDDETGSILRQEETPGAILDADFSRSGRLRCITSEGYYTSCNTSGSGYMAVQNMPRYLVSAVLRSDNAWLLARRGSSSLSSRILQFSFNNNDDNWESFPDPVDYISPENSYVCDDAFVLLDSAELICAVNPDGGYVDSSDVRHFPLGDYRSSYLRILGFSPDKEYILLKYDHPGETGLLLADRQTGRIAAQEVPADLQIRDVDYVNGTLYYLWTAPLPQDPWQTQIRLCTMPFEALGTDEEDHLWDSSAAVTEGEFSAPDGELCIDPTGRFAFILSSAYNADFEQENRIFFLNIPENTVSECMIPADDLPEYFYRDLKYYAFWEDTSDHPKDTPRLAFTGTSGVRVFDCRGSLQKTLRSGSSAPLSVLFSGSDDLIVFFKSGHLRRFSIGQEKITDTLDLADSSSSETDRIRLEYLDDQTLIIYQESAARLIYLPQWQQVSSVPVCLGYIPSGGRFLCCDGNELGYRVRYSTQTLIEKAREALGSYALSEAQKYNYGL